MLVELDIKNAPITAGNFLKLCEQNVYKGASFYRSVRSSSDKNPVPISVVQGGVSRITNSPRIDPIPHETTDTTGLTHSYGTLSMARGRPGSASSEFFICVGDNPELDFGGHRNPDGQGFAAFGKVIEGFQTLQDIWGSPAMGENIDPPVTIYNIIKK